MLDEDDLCERRCFFPEEFERVSERLSPQARSLWAKTGRGEQSHLWELLYVHMGDSGEIARLLWSKWLPRTVKKLIAQDLSDSAAESLVAWMASVHDIGKATPTFQYKVTDRAESVRETGLEIPAGIDSKSHAFMGQVILEDWLFDRAWSHPNIFSCVVGGHHGAPPDSSTILDNLRDSLFPKEVLGESTWTTVQIELLDYASNSTALEMPCTARTVVSACAANCSMTPDIRATRSATMAAICTRRRGRGGVRNRIRGGSWGFPQTVDCCDFLIGDGFVGALAQHARVCRAPRDSLPSLARTA